MTSFLNNKPHPAGYQNMLTGLPILQLMQKLIQQKLEEIGQQELTLLYACESGSRGWQFPSPDSDYDVRFIFVRPQEYYLTVNELSEDLQFPIANELDIYGWDIRKVLRLMAKSNTTPFEWLQSPIVYKSQPGFREELWNLSQQYFSQRSHIFHYLGVATSAMASFTDNGQIGIKKLFYILRPLLAASWCFHKKSIAPMTIGPLMQQLPAVLHAELTDLITQKAHTPEQQLVTLSHSLSNYIHTTYEDLRTRAGETEKAEANIKSLNEFFRQLVRRYEHPRH